MDRIISEYSDRDCVSNLKGQVSDDNQVVLSWEWPDNEEYDLCVVYGLENEGETLDMLLERDARRTVYANSLGACHRETILTAYMQFRVYPAKRVQDGLCIIDQRSHNLSEIFQKKIRLPYHVEYEKLGRLDFAKQYRRARITIQGLNQVTDEYICYRCVGGGLEGLSYGIDLASFSGGMYEICVGRNETIELFLEDSQKNHIELVSC